MNKRFIISFLACIVWLTAWTQEGDREQSGRKFSSLLGLLELNYLDSVNLPLLTETAIKALLKELDPHSVYIAQKDVEKTNEPLVGSYDGVGITYQIMRDTIMVISATPGGPSEEAGITGGDRIVSIDRENAAGEKLDEAFVRSRLRGKRGTEVEIGILRYGSDSILTFKVKRDKIPIQTIVASYMLDDNTAYIRLNRFSSQSAREFRTELKKLKEEGMENLVFDLRGNSGGYMNVAVDIASEFLEKGKTVVYTRGLNSPRQDYVSDGNGLCRHGRLIVLLDEGSASASEIVSGAVQDNDRGLLMGRRSYGKGLVQKSYFLPDGSQVRITTARYYTPSGRCIQRPYSEGNEYYFKEYSRRLKHGELVHADSIRFPDSLRYYTASGRLVFGGGGIMPDLFMAVDSSLQSDYYGQLLRKAVIAEYCVSFIDRNRGMLKKRYKNETDFIREFQADDAMMEDLVRLAGQREIAPNDEQIAVSSLLIRTQVKANLARSLFGLNAYHRVLGGLDPMLTRASEVIEDVDEYQRLTLGQ